MSAGIDVVESGGVGSSATVSAGGIEYDLGTTFGTVLMSGGSEYVLAGGIASGTVISSGGGLYVSSGGVGSSTVVLGRETVSSGGTLGGATLSGGLIEIMSSGTAGASQINFTSAGGTLQLDQSVLFSGVISGFGVPGGIDLRDIAFGSGTTLGYSDSGGSGTLTVQAGSNTATINLIGQYVQANFHIQADGHGGTLVTDPPVQSLTGGIYIPHS